MKLSKLVQFTLELCCACLIAYAMIQVMGCISMKQVVAYAAITGRQ